jgi:hypothetical protein
VETIIFEAYSIGVTLKLNNLISPQLKLIAEGFEKLEGLTTALKTALKSIGVESAGLRSVARDALASTEGLDRATVAADRLERRLAALRVSASTMPGIPMLPAGGAGGGGRWGGGGGGGHRNGFHGGNIHMGPGGIGVGTIGMAAGDAFVPLAVAMGMMYAGHATYESAKELDTERARFRLFGLSDAQNSEAFRFVDGMRVYGSTRATNMRNFREAQGVFREAGESDSSALAGAKLATPVLSQLDFLASSLDGESAAKMRTANMAMLRYVEMSGGLKDASTFNRLADFGWKLNQSSGGTVDWEQLRALKSTAGVAGYNLTDDALARLEPIMGELKGGGAGTALATSFGRLSGVVRVPNQIAHALVDNGLWDASKVAFNANGGIKNIKGNPLGAANTKLFEENPELFYEQVIRPMYKKMNLSQEDIARENLALFGRTGGKLFEAIERSLPVIQQSVEAMKKTKNITDSVAEAKKSLGGQEKEFEAAWTDFKTQFGTTALPFFTGILKGGAAILRLFGDNGAQGQTARTAFKLAFAPGAAMGDLVKGWFQDKPSALATGQGDPHIARPADRPINVHTALNLDGHKIASVVFKRAATELGRPQAGGSSYDPTLGLEPAGG